jgi:murein DD-endopeptidase MepM/ murein hydrolase activator NlpD
MAGTKYKFNPDSLSFDKVRLGARALFFRFLAYFTGSLLIAIVYWIIYAAFFDSPREKALQREVEQMSIQYDLIQRDMANIENVIAGLEKTDDNLYRTIFEAEPIPLTIREGGSGGVNRYSTLEGYTNSNLVIETAARLEKIRKRVYVQSRSFDDLIVLAENKEEMLRSVPAIFPVSNKDLKRTASGFGIKINPFYSIKKPHNGMDFTAPEGTEVYATGNGVVRAVLRSKRGFGNHAIIDHGFGYVTTYAHLSDFNNLKYGQKVKRGDIIGYVGNTGISLSNHLHYEIKLNGVYVDPVNYFFQDLTSEDYVRMIEIAYITGRSFD